MAVITKFGGWGQLKSLLQQRGIPSEALSVQHENKLREKFLLTSVKYAPTEQGRPIPIPPSPPPPLDLPLHKDIPLSDGVGLTG